MGKDGKKRMLQVDIKPSTKPSNPDSKVVETRCLDRPRHSNSTATELNAA